MTGFFGQAPLPSSADWRFDEIAAIAPERANALEEYGDSASLIDALTSALDAALRRGDVRFGWEHSDTRDGSRAVLQFPVPPALFDWFFNGRSGYRAHFWASIGDGEALNDLIVRIARQKLEELGPQVVDAFLLGREFTVVGRKQMPLSSFAGSVLPDLTKIWFCGLLIMHSGSVEPNIPELSGPKIKLGDGRRWPAIFQDDAWLELKGAFVGDGEPFQHKSRQERCARLRSHGEA